MAPASAVPLAAPADPAVVAVDSDAAAVLVLNAGSSSLKAALISATGALLWRDQWRWDVAAVIQDGVLHPLLDVGGTGAELSNTIDHINH
ncbi:MAG: hypothetical protein ACKOPS_25010, partial [Cyanobium sp.]